MIDQKRAFVAMTENEKDSYLPHGSRVSTMLVSLQDPDVQLQSLVGISVFKVQAILFEFQLYEEE